ncbi:Ribosome biogenesis protein BMS1-like [Homarus americanus]|uniref:Ribosome biogenesis protein BMS1-like n=1 Tax=Homarus americanus TaxID=6706 RepID=A0A8J5JAM9_HOMAM|nr:Ribosome biogenesis protein BMS1-like [Homarus americanus]
MGEETDFDKKKGHSHRHAGRKAEKKSAKNEHVQELTDKQRNPKAFAFNSAVKAQRRFVRTQDIKSKKHHIPVVDRTPLEPPPVIVAVVGGPKVGKSTLLRCLIKNYTNQRFSEINGPVTIVAGKKRRLTFIEVNNDINCMIDIAKVADIVLMLIDATFGIEMEVFEFLEICRAHGTPRIMGVLNHLDMLKDNKALKKKKKALKHRFQVELYPGAKLFYLSGLVHEEYLKNEVKNLGRFISVMKFRPLTWRTTHPFVVVDRYEDITNPESIRTNPKCDRDVVLYGYVRGVPFQKTQSVHIPGCGDFKIKDLSFLPDPCPLPEHLKKRSLNAKERLTYAPMSGVGGIVYDKDAVYIDLGGSHHGNKVKVKDEESEEEDSVLEPLLGLQKTADEKQAQSQIQLFSRSQFISSDVLEDDDDDDEEEEEDVRKDEINYSKAGDKLPAYETVSDSTGRVRRRAIFTDNLEVEDNDDSSDDEDDDESDEESDQEEVNEMAPPRKKSKSQPSCETREREPNSDSDSDDYDLDADLQDVRCLQNHDGGTSHSMGSLSQRRTPYLKNNKDSDVTVKIQGLLEKITKSSDQKPKIKPISGGDSGFSNEENDSEDDVMDEGDGLSQNNNVNMNSVEKKIEEGSDSDQDDSDSEEEDGRLEYRSSMFKQATQNFYRNQSTVSYLRKYIYGDVKEEERNADENDEVGGLFKRPTRPKSSGGEPVPRALIDEVDTSRYVPSILRDWSVEELQHSIRDCFMTGDWSDDKDAQTLLKMDEEDIYGDFEDLETGKKFSANTEGKENEEVTEDSGPEVKKEKSAKEKLIEKKLRLKQMFDAEYDDNGSGEHFDSLKAEMNQQAQLNRQEFEGLDDELRVQYEGYRPGLYVRMEFSHFPCEFITNFDPSYPVIVGGLLDNENNMGFVRVRIKVHRWYPKILKNRDPLILSLGWRRFQTLMYYAKREDNFRMRSLKYARKYLHIEAMFWGPITLVNTGFVALQNITDRVDMFHSETEIAKFEGAKIQTQSGIRGIIKKSKGQKGLFRATFEDSIKMSDVVILKTWVPVEMTQFCFSVYSLLLPPSEKAAWQGMRTVAQIKKDKGIRTLVNPDSLYTPITNRREYIPLPLKIPRELQKALPYSEKPKVIPTAKKAQRVLVVKDSKEIQMDNFMKRLKTMMEHKMEKEEIASAERRKKFQEDIEEREHMRQVREKRKKAAACRYKSKKQGKKNLV